jgi:hypothetical protein
MCGLAYKLHAVFSASRHYRCPCLDSPEKKQRPWLKVYRCAFFDRLAPLNPLDPVPLATHLSCLPCLSQIFSISTIKRGLNSNGFYVLPVKEETLFPLQIYPNFEDDDLPSVKEIIVCAWRDAKNPQPSISPGDDADDDVVVSWSRKPPGRLGIIRS